MLCITCDRAGHLEKIRWLRMRGYSWRPHQADQDFLERRLRSIEVGRMRDAGGAKVAQRLVSPWRSSPLVSCSSRSVSWPSSQKFEAIGSERLGDGVDLALQSASARFPCRALHHPDEPGLSFDQDDLAVVLLNESRCGRPSPWHIFEVASFVVSWSG